MKVKIAGFGSTTSETFDVLACYGDGSCWADSCETYYRVTETSEIDLKELPKSTINEKKLKVIDDKIRETQGLLYKLEQSKKEILALDYFKEDK